MTRKILAVAAAVVALGFGASPALAAGKGVGPSEGTTGKARACQAHILNKGKSVAKGLDCAPTATLVVEMDPATCMTTITGSGLLPGSQLTFSYDADPTNLYPVGPPVDQSGNFFAANLGGEGEAATIYGTTSSNTPISSPWPACFVDR